MLAAVPFIKSMAPSARALALGGPAQIDISKLEQGQMISDIWQGKPAGMGPAAHGADAGSIT